MLCSVGRDGCNVGTRGDPISAHESYCLILTATMSPIFCQPFHTDNPNTRIFLWALWMTCHRLQNEWIGVEGTKNLTVFGGISSRSRAEEVHIRETGWNHFPYMCYSKNPKCLLGGFFVLFFCPNHFPLWMFSQRSIIKIAFPGWLCSEENAYYGRWPRVKKKKGLTDKPCKLSRFKVLFTEMGGVKYMQYGFHNI